MFGHDRARRRTLLRRLLNVAATGAAPGDPVRAPLLPRAYTTTLWNFPSEYALDILEIRFRVIARVALVLGSTGAVSKVVGSGLTTPTWAT